MLTAGTARPARVIAVARCTPVPARPETTRAVVPPAGINLLVVQPVCAVTVALLLRRQSSPGAAARGLVAFSTAALLQSAGIRWVSRRAGFERSTPADPITLARFAAGNTVCALVASGAGRRVPALSRAAWWAAALGATASDWLDGPVARRYGPTKLGAVMDIEADSWLTLWTAAAAVHWGGLPPPCLFPPLIRYVQPVVDIRSGRLPRGGGPWWFRMSGTAQMIVLLAAFAPFARAGALGPRLPIAVSTLQTASLLAALRRSE